MHFIDSRVLSPFRGRAMFASQSSLLLGHVSIRSLKLISDCSITATKSTGQFDLSAISSRQRKLGESRLSAPLSTGQRSSGFGIETANAWISLGYFKRWMELFGSKVEDILQVIYTILPTGTTFFLILTLTRLCIGYGSVYTEKILPEQTR